MAMRLRRRRRRIHIEGWHDVPRPSCVNRASDPFGDFGSPPFDAVRNLTETGELPELFAGLPNAMSDEVAWVLGCSLPSLPAIEITATATLIAAEPTP